MPTMVERLADLLQDALTLDAIDSAGAESAFAALDAEIDPGLSALQAATTPRAFAAADRQYGRAFEDLGVGAFGLGGDLQRDAFVFYVVDQVLGGGSPNGATGAEADFLTADGKFFGAGADLESFGFDLFRLGQVHSQTALSTVDSSLQTDSQTLQADFSALGGDVATLVGDFQPSPTAVAASPLSALASALSPLGGEFSAISADFGALANLFGGGAVVTSAAAVSGGGGASGSAYGAAFAALDTDFLSLDKSLQALAGPLANLLLPAVQTPG